jgi:hypothetical protein
MISNQNLLKGNLCSAVPHFDEYAALETSPMKRSYGKSDFVCDSLDSETDFSSHSHNLSRAASIHEIQDRLKPDGISSNSSSFGREIRVVGIASSYE